jgi:hypothetical protein
MTDAHCITIVAAILRSADMRHHRNNLPETRPALAAYIDEAITMLEGTRQQCDRYTEEGAAMLKGKPKAKK